MSRRILIVIGFFGLAYSFLLFNLYNIQINKKVIYEAEAESQQEATGIINPLRGIIYFTDRNNKTFPAVLNKDYFLVYIVPKEIQQAISDQKIDPALYNSKLNEIFDIPAEEIGKKINKPNDLYEVIFYKASQEQVNSVKELGLKGIYIKKQIGRYYPSGNLASHLLGFVSPAEEGEEKNSCSGQKGRYGLEAFFEKELCGEKGELKGDKIIAPKDGKDINLTIDFNIQTQSDEILRKLVEKWGASSGSVIVQDPKTGRILAMASMPDFDPNNYSKSDIGNFINPVSQLVYEPGSVFKIITMSAGIDSGKITPDTTYYDSGSVVLNGREIKNWDLKAHGKLTMTNVIEQSINTGSVFAEKTMGHEIFSDYVNRFGFGELSGIKLPGELKGNLINLKSNRDVNFATASFGQGVAITPIEMINAASAIANGGILMRPIILAGENPQEIRRVISQDTARKVVEMMVSAVKKNVIADIPKYNIAGKTGTAFIPDFKIGGYTDQVINTYIGFAPAFDPKFIILIKLEKPQNAPLAGQTVVPAFKELAEFILNYYNIAPDNIAD